MYDIKIFLEENWEFWARVNAWKETIYWAWKTQDELMVNMKDGLQIAFQNKEKNAKVSQLFNYFNDADTKTLCR